MDRDNEIELVQTIQEKDRRIKELETINENITRELLSRAEKLENVLKEKQDSIPKDKLKEIIEKVETKKRENDRLDRPTVDLMLVYFKELIKEE